VNGYPSPRPSPARGEGEEPPPLAGGSWGRGARERLVRALEGDPTIGAEVRAVDPALVVRLTVGAGRRTRPRPALGWSALAACALLGVWVGWTAADAAPAPTLLAAVQITPLADPPP